MPLKNKINTIDGALPPQKNFPRDSDPSDPYIAERVLSANAENYHRSEFHGTLSCSDAQFYSLTLLKRSKLL